MSDAVEFAEVPQLFERWLSGRPLADRSRREYARNVRVYCTCQRPPDPDATARRQWRQTLSVGFAPLMALPRLRRARDARARSPAWRCARRGSPFNLAAAQLALAVLMGAVGNEAFAGVTQLLGVCAPPALRRSQPPWSRRIAQGGDPYDLAELIEFRRSVDDAIASAVAEDGLERTRGRDQEVADATGTTRQAAQQRWGHA